MLQCCASMSLRNNLGIVVACGGMWWHMLPQLMFRIVEACCSMPLAGWIVFSRVCPETPEYLANASFTADISRVFWALAARPELWKVVDEIRVFARMTPQGKAGCGIRVRTVA